MVQVGTLVIIAALIHAKIGPLAPMVLVVTPAHVLLTLVGVEQHVPLVLKIICKLVVVMFVITVMVMSVIMGLHVLMGLLLTPVRALMAGWVTGVQLWTFVKEMIVHMVLV